jgi:hypothetical protein
LYATPLTPLRRFSAHARFHASALSLSSPLPLARPLAMPYTTLTSPSFSYSLFYRSSVAPLDLHVEVIIMRITSYARRSHSRSAVTIALSTL